MVTFITANFQRCVSQPCYTHIKTEVRMSLNIYEKATKFLIMCLTLPSISVGINTSSKLWLMSAHNHSLPLNLGGDSRSYFFTKDKLNLVGQLLRTVD